MIQHLRRDTAEVIATAWPLMLSTGLFSITLFVDRMLLFRYSEGSAAAAMAAGTLFWALTCFPSGLCGYTSAFVSQYLAAKRPDRALSVVWQGILLALAVGPVLIGFGFFAKSFFLVSGHPEELASQEAAYFVWLVPGAWGTVVASALVGLFAGSGRTRVLILSDLGATVINVVFDFLLIFGLWGFPELGAAGAAIASSMSLLFKLFVIAMFALPDLRAGFVRTRSTETGKLVCDLSHVPPGMRSPALRWELPLMMRLVHYGWPAGVSVLAEAWSFTIIMMIVGGLGEHPAAATTLALGVNLLAFIPLVGLGIAVGVLVGKYLVHERRDIARRMVFSGLVIGLAYSSIFVVLYGGFPDAAMTVYSLDIDPARFDAMRPTLRPLLYFIAGYCVFDAFQTVYVGALKGAGDTFFVLFGHILAGGTTVLGGLAVSYLTGWNGLYYWWSVITFWVILLACIFTARYLHGGWQDKRVIEPAVIDEALEDEEAIQDIIVVPLPSRD
ncbi:Multidrug resistance protein NorM [Pirellula sp. SH-Sr6A]|uniref:MATE family efflux transporter n=1 Tax=Pirellula sp. SH-Sr6A TaxID=1632865 RepID=UPI00078EA059|nr:MATE family efflux transporter [Pirellula sp. SH-Sr6A]AMV32864.1 Multidrug resistance protein NorM [Pirellula sp. SH-Sr6A]